VISCREDNGFTNLGKTNAIAMSGSDQYTLETPENIQVQFELAGLGTRFCAMLVDTLLLGAIIVVLLIFMAIMGLSIFSVFESKGSAQWILAVILAVVVALFFGGYFILFEWLMRGQTPGKKALKIRVIRDDGTPATIHEVLVRNVLRLIDFLPFAYAVGAIVMFANRLSKRLGDIAAGTIVIKEAQLDYRANADKSYALNPMAIGEINAELTVAERRLVTGFLQRRSELLPKAREELAERLARPLHEKYGGEYSNAESYLVHLVEGRHYES
jgi:uncharacterized RDD family membrane protein YckC